MGNTERYFGIRNWNVFQHYKGRNPPWIKLHNSLLDDYDFEALTDFRRGQLLCLWMLASRKRNVLKWDKHRARRDIKATNSIDLDYFLAAGWIFIHTSESLALCKHLYSPSRVDKIREEKKRGGASARLSESMSDDAPERELTDSERREVEEAITEAKSLLGITD